jgi:hypothetical protein
MRKLLVTKVLTQKVKTLKEIATKVKKFGGFYGVMENECLQEKCSVVGGLYRWSEKRLQQAWSKRQISRKP